MLSSGICHVSMLAIEPEADPDSLECTKRPPHVRNFVHSNSKQSSTEREDDLLILSLMLRMDIKLAPMIEGIGREENLLYIDKFVLLTIRKTCILISHFSHFLIQNITFVFPIFYNIVGASS